MATPNKPLLRNTFLNAVTGAANNGAWLDVSGWAGMNVHVSGINGDTVRVYGSNSPTVPANDAVGFQIGNDITVNNSFLYFAGPCLWMKVSVPTWSAGTISAWAVGIPY